jgi:hypothetical protein
VTPSTARTRMSAHDAMIDEQEVLDGLLTDLRIIVDA